MRFLMVAHAELERCEKARAYFAGIILMGAVVEFALTGLVHAWSHEVTSRGRRVREHWDLISLNAFGRDVGWLDRRAFFAAERIRKHRNLVHPNWFAGRQPPTVTKSLFVARRDDLDDVWRSMSDWVETVG
ncbi:MAG TPA: hypothetical protein VG942_06170 [Hyphomonadaceae bacterium]|nr:hypothetical protein [Hyphomonadaceae bacterium]